MMDFSGRGPEQGAITVNTPTKSALLDRMTAHLRAGEGFTVATINLDHAVKLRSDDGFHAAYAKQSIVVADGNPIVWLSRLAGARDVELVPGSDMLRPALELAAKEGVAVAFFGSTPETLALAAERLQADYPTLQIAAKISPPFGYDPMGDKAAADIEDLAASGARLIFLALGAPKQEIFAARAAQHIPNAGFMSIGASLDFVAGSQTRAPRLVRVLALEWVWRMLSNPRRLALRYGRCIALLPSLTRAALRAGKGSRDVPPGAGGPRDA